MDAELPEEEKIPWTLELRIGIKETKMLYDCIRVYSNLIDIDEEETEEKEYIKT